MGNRTAPTVTPDTRVALAGIAVLIAVGLAQLSDFLTFLRMVSVGGLAAELNPLVAHGAEALGYTVLGLVKVALVVLVAAVFAIVARRRRVVAAVVATMGTFAGFLGAFSNLLAIV